MSTENRRRIGEGVALILYFILDAYEVWPQSHSIALLTAVLGVSAVLYAEFSIRSWVVSTAGIATAAIAIFVIVGPVTPETSRGWLQPANEPTPENGCDSARAHPLPPGFTPLPPPETPIVIVGTDGLLLTHPGTRGIISIGDCDSLSLDRTESGVQVSGSIYAKNGILLGKIEENGFEIIKDEHITIERSGDLSTLSVHDGKTEVLYVKYVNKRAIKVRGRFYCPSKPNVEVIVTDDFIMFGGFTTSDSCAIDFGRGDICIDCEAPRR